MWSGSRSGYNSQQQAGFRTQGRRSGSRGSSGARDGSSGWGQKSRSGRRSGRNMGGDRTSAYGGYYGGASQTQTQRYSLDTTQLEAQVIFVDQATTCLTVAESYMDNVASGADQDVLNATASGMVACLNLMRMTALERQNDREGLNAAKAMVKKFEEKCRVKYGGVEDSARVKIEQVGSAVCGHMISVLSGDRDVPVFEVSRTDPASDADKGTVTRTMQEVMRGGHEVEDLRARVRKNASQYRESLENEAKVGADWGEEEQRRFRFNADSARRALQSDMTSLAPVRNARELTREAKRSLKALVDRDEMIASQCASHVDVDENGRPNLMNEDSEMEQVQESPSSWW